MIHVQRVYYNCNGSICVSWTVPNWIPQRVRQGRLQCPARLVLLPHLGHYITSNCLLMQFSHRARITYLLAIAMLADLLWILCSIGTSDSVSTMVRSV